MRQSSGLSFSVGLGALGQGDPEVSLREEEDIPAVKQSDLDREEQEVGDELCEFDTFPVIQAGVRYRF